VALPTGEPLTDEIYRWTCIQPFRYSKYLK
jgi:hypothetical protein